MEDRSTVGGDPLRAEDGPEIARLLRSRLVGTSLMWALALFWSRVGDVSLFWISVVSVASLGFTASTIALLRRRPRATWAGELHVAADIVIMPAFLWASGGDPVWANPFVSILVAKGVGGSLVVGKKRGLLYALATIIVVWASWVAAMPRAGVAEASTVAALVVAALCVVVLQAAEQPLELYRLRRRDLVRENRRLAVAIDALEMQNRQLRALQELALGLGTLGAVEEVALRLRDSLARTFPGHAASFFLFRREPMVLELVLLAEGVDPARAARLAGVDGALTRALVSSQGPEPIRGSPSEALDLKATAILHVPLRLSEKPVGMLVLESNNVTELPGADRELLGVIAREMAVALRNADLYARARELRESVESMIENANALIFVVGPEGIVEVVNRALLERLDVASSPVGRSVGGILAGGSESELMRALELVRAGSPVENLPLVLKEGGGGERRAVFSLGPVYRGGAFRSAIAVGQDVTRLELLERELLQREKLASLGQFVAGIAHEMNNPLTTITAYGSYLRGALRRGPPSGEDVDKLEEVLTAGERIRGFVQSLLGFARQSHDQLKPIDMNGVVREAVRLCRHDLAEGRLQVSTQLAPGLPPILGVEAELQQLFINLFTNSAQAMVGEGGHLKVRTELTGQTIRVTVQDDGPGIPPSILSRIFDPFFTTKPEGRGTGLGLSIVKRVVDRHQGRIQVTSPPGEGTRFVLELAAATPTSVGASES